MDNHCNMLRLLVLGFLCVGSLGFEAKPPMRDNRIVGGVETTIEAHPHQVSYQPYCSHHCGASIIGRSWAITAAHCLGPWNISGIANVGSTFTKGGESYMVMRTIKHPLFDRLSLDYDIGLIEISGEFKQKETIKPIALATVELPANTIVNVTGWGALSDGGKPSDVLMQISIPIVSREKCAEAYAGLYPITERMICAGFDEGGIDGCQGDSGGPVTADNVLYGIVSWGYDCGRPKYPGVHTNVVALRPWIKSITGI